MAIERFPKIRRGIVADLRKVDDMAVLLGAIADDRRFVRSSPLRSMRRNNPRSGEILSHRVPSAWIIV